MRSFLLEYEARSKTETEKETEIDIHINLWRVNEKDNYTKIVLDFGFMIYDIKKVKSLILYCPFSVVSVNDLGKSLSRHPKLINAIFNEECEVVSNIHPNRTKITKKGDDFKQRSDEQDSFILYTLYDPLICCKHENKFSRIRIDLSNILSGNECNISSISDEKKYYFRIRLLPKNDDFMKILKRENEHINILQDSSLRTTEIIDFRINDFRSITENLKEEAYRLNTFNISSVHYLIMRNSTDEYISGADKYKSRILENEVWNDYIELSEENDIVAYHFKEISKKEENGRNYIASFTNLSRFKYPLNVRERLCIYLLIVVVISIASNFLYSILTRVGG